MYVVDNFLRSYDALREHADGLDFVGVRNPVDNVVYPGISLDVPEHVKQEIIECASRKIGLLVLPQAIFMRLSLSGVPVPHQAHTDSTMGEWSLMLYLNRQEHCKGGTSLVQHRVTGMDSDPRSSLEQKIWQTDTNKPDMWRVTQMALMYPNRAFIFPSHKMHRAEPVGGFGDNNKNGRLVLTMFFNTSGETNVNGNTLRQGDGH